MILLALYACAPVEFDLTYIDDLQIVAVQIEPPALAPGLPVTLTAWVADPEKRGADVLIYTCTNLGYGCAEGGYLSEDDFQTPPQPLSTWTAVGQLDGTEISFDFRLPDDEGALLQQFQQGQSETLLFALACEPGACEIIDRVMANPPPGSEAYQALLDLFADPEPWVAELPRESSSFAVKRVNLQGRDEINNVNPTVTPTAGIVASRFATSWSVLPEPVIASFGLADNGPAGKLDVRAYTTLGSVQSILPGATTSITWDPGTRIGHGDLFIVVVDDASGIGVWSSDVSVGPPIE